MNIDEEDSESEYSDSDEEFTSESSTASSPASLVSTSETSDDGESFVSTQSLLSQLASRPLVKYFKFEQVRYASATAAPSKRSGHRAVCNAESMWIWGGYCPAERPAENNAEPPFPLFKEVTAHASL